jgi:hypothetical protein
MAYFMLRFMQRSTFMGFGMLKGLGKMLAASSFAAAGMMVAVATPASAGTIILEGSDAIGFHCGSAGTDGDACEYRDQVWTALGGSSSEAIAAIGDVHLGTNTHAVDNFTSVAAAGDLSNYVALYFTAQGGCCSENNGIISNPADQAAILAYYNAGGVIMIENYTGSASWDFLMGTGGTGNSHVAGFDGGLGGFSCSDGETVSAAGLLNGFTQPGPLSCWTHQAYDQSFFGPLGFTLSYFNSPPEAPAGFSSLLSNGLTQTGVDNGGDAVPEPLTMSIFAAGLLGAGALRRRIKSRA